MWRGVLWATLALASAPAHAQWPPWADDAFGGRSSPRYEHPYSEPKMERRAPEKSTRDGGSHPHIEPQAPAVVAFPYDYPLSSIVIDTSGKMLYYVLANQQAFAYPISVGREGFNWTGTETISRKQAWPDWYPPEEMRERDPKLPEKMTGGLKNPLGAMALYLGTTLYRIHGTNDVKSIGQAQSSGCFRMMNAAVLHLASLAEVGTAVTVVAALPKGIEVSQTPPATRGLETVPIEAGRIDRPVSDYQDLRSYMLRKDERSR
jgi:lipoprotein-anchoring transpeptidase ErfK/SrfK